MSKIPLFNVLEIYFQVITERELKAKSFSLDQWFQTVDGAVDREKAQRVSALGVKWRKKATNPRIEFRNKLIKEVTNPKR